jgi:anti-sigma factor RsiW
MAAWLRGELTPDEEAAWLASSAADPALASEVAAHRRTIESLRELPREIEPGRDLYPGIAARLTPARRRAGPSPWQRP